MHQAKSSRANLMRPTAIHVHRRELLSRALPPNIRMARQ